MRKNYNDIELKVKSIDLGNKKKKWFIQSGSTFSTLAPQLNYFKQKAAFINIPRKIHETATLHVMMFSFWTFG